MAFSAADAQGEDAPCEDKPGTSEPGDRNGVELPPELCRVVMAPVSANTLRVFTFVPSIMYRIQCILLSVKLKIQLGPRMQQFNVKALKIVEALTTTECQEEFSQESLETLGDSFLNLKKISIKSDRIADSVEALIAAYLSLGGEHDILIVPVDSDNCSLCKCDKEKVWRATKRLLQPLATAETVERDPVTELKQLCEQKNYPAPSYSTTVKDGVTTVIAKVWVAGALHSCSGTRTGRNKDAMKSAAKALLKKLKAAGVP
ncbi:hypothetical protein PR202_ga12574 [Eleusine coracana subsp. coracana]|uniref:DRBM domain-containing protein n=1 Tax=Eleusine coracana subsp. coracana TaxID=191504 RepID=A0AAV5CCK9_ELECO|nr:hypothetical protein PR202_ga12574 [Eleusine coracana subsp. coracana]